MASTLHATRGRRLSLAAALVLGANAPAWAQQDSALTREAYITPTPEVARVVLAPRHENVALTNISPDKRYFLHALSEGAPYLADFGRPYHNLGGVQIDPAASRARQFTTGTGTGFELIAAEGGRRVRVSAPAGARVSSAQWSPDGKKVAYFAHFRDATYIYVADVATGKSQRVTRTPVLATLVTSIEWAGDDRIATVLVPEGRGAAPKEPAVAAHPRVRIANEGENKLRTYASLLDSPHEQALLEYYITGQLALVDLKGGVRKVGKPAMIQRIDPSPSGEFVRVTTIQKPFSYVAPVSNFATIEEIWNANGAVLAEIQKRPLNEGVRAAGRDSADAASARRNLAWRPDGAGLGYLQQEPAPRRQGGQNAQADAAPAAEPAKRKDRVMQWLPPFDSTSTRVVYESEERIASVQYSEDARLLFLTESARGTSHLYAVSLDEPQKKHTLYRHRTEDFYADPGTLMTVEGRRGRGGAGGGGGFGFGAQPTGVVLVSTDGNSVYLSGTTYSKKPLEEAPRPFVDRVEIRTGKKERIFESEANVFEQVAAVLDADLKQIVTSRETPKTVPDYYLRDRQSGALKKLTENKDVSPELTAAQRQVIEVTRVDGIKFWVKVTLPASYKAGERLPAMFWFYPREYTDQKAYDRVNRAYNKNQFPRIGARTMEILTQAGYAVIEPDAPIIGAEGRMNDNYIPDLRNNLIAVIDDLDRRGFIDRDRLALGGHSYGAFSTFNAMVNLPFFKAGIAGDGNSNRMLTPTGFQTERRELWQARDLYLEMSPLLYADRLQGALLMYHGIDDQNVGTHPIHSIRLMHALNALGKTASLYMYPYEDHGPATRETLLDLWARWTAWLDKYVKNAKPAAAAAEVAATN